MRTSRRSPRFKKILSTMLSLLLLLACIPVPAFSAGLAVSSLSTPSTELQVGQEFTVTANMSNLSGVGMAEVELVFDTSKLEFIRLQGGDLNWGSNPVIMSDSTGTDGAVSYSPSFSFDAMGQEGFTGLSGDGFLATFTFRVRKAGTVQIQNNTMLFDSSLNQLAAGTDFSATGLQLNLISNVASPTASVAPGTYYTAKDVTLSTSTAGATIYYTTDGSSPLTGTLDINPAAITYDNSPITINSTTTIKAVAAVGTDVTPVQTFVYTIETVQTPVPDRQPGNYYATTTLSFTTTTAGAQIYYTMTTNGTEPADPTTASQLYTAPITLPAQEGYIVKYKALAYKEGGYSTVAGPFTYTYQTAPVPLATPAPGTYYKALNVTLSSTEGQVYYTLDGSDPKTGGQVYSSPIPINQTTNIKAVVKMGENQFSDVTETYSYTIDSVSAPVASPISGSYVVPMDVVLNTATNGAVVYYTVATGGSLPPNPTTESQLYSNPIQVQAGVTAIKAVAFYDSPTGTEYDAYSDVVTFTYKDRNSENQIAQLLGTMKKMADLSYSEVDGLMTIIRQGATLGVMSEDQKNLLASNGLTSQDLTVLLNTAEAYFADEQKWASFSASIKADDYNTLLTFLNEIKAAVPAAFKTSMLAKGLNADQLIQVFVEFTAKSLDWLNVTTQLKTEVDSILQGGVYDDVSKSILAANGINWENFNQFISGLTTEQKSLLKNIIEKITNYLIPPTSNIQSGNYNSSQTLTLSCAGGTIKYTMDGSTPSEFNGLTYANPITLSAGTYNVKAIRIDGTKVSSPLTLVITVQAQVVAAPTASVQPGTYYIAKQVELSSATTGADIYYTTDGTAPTLSSTKYTGAINVNRSMTIKAFAAKDGSKSAVVSFAYTIGQVAAPAADNTTGTYVGGVTVKLSSATQGAEIFYTTDGSTPTAQSTKYTAPINITTNNTVLKAIAVYSGQQSTVSSFTYTISGITAPTANPAAGTYTTAQTVGLSSSIVGARIYYTTDETDPTVSSNLYSAPISVNQSMTIKAKAYVNGVFGPLATFSYVIQTADATPVADVASGIYNTPKTIKLSSVPEAKIYYVMTTDGSEPAVPTDQNSEFTAETQILVAAGQLVRIKAVAKIGANPYSTEANFSYEVLVAPTITPPADQNGYNAPILVTMNSVNTGSNIYYTTDGSEPTNRSTLYTGPVRLSADTTLKAITFKSGVSSLIAGPNVYDFKTGNISGRVVDIDGNGISGIRVNIEGSTKNALTGADGSYTIANVYEGNKTVYTYNTLGFTANPLNRTVAVAADEPVLNVNFEMVRGAVLKGVILDQDGSPLAGVDVSANGSSNTEQFWGESTTDGNGRFLIDGLGAASNYVVSTANDMGYQDISYNVANTLTAGTVTDIGALTIRSFSSMEASINGKLTIQAGNPIAGVTVETWGEETGDWASDVTDAQGNYELTGLTPGGGYEVYVFGEGVTVSPIRNITLGMGQDYTLNITAETASTLTGRVTVKDSDPVTGIANMSVYVYNPATFAGGFAMTDADGNYTVSNLPKGNGYIVEIYYSDFVVDLNKIYVDSRVDKSLNITQDQETYNIEMALGAEVRGFVRADGNPINGARITARGNNGWFSATTGVDGAYVIKGMPTGNYTIEVYTQGYELPAPINQDIVAGQQYNNVNFNIVSLNRVHFSGEGNGFRSINNTVPPGGVINYRAEYKNTGATVNNAGLTVTLPSGVTYKSGSAMVNNQKVTAQVNGQNVTIPLGDIANGGEGRVRFQATVTKTPTFSSVELPGRIAGELLGVAVTEVLHTDITAPGAAKTNQDINVYGKSSNDAKITIYAKAVNETQFREIIRTKANGKWWKTKLKFAATGTYQLYALATEFDENGTPTGSSSSDIVQVTVSEDVPVLDVVRVQAGWNPWVSVRPTDAIPALAAAQTHTVYAEADFSGVLPANVKMEFDGAEYGMTATGNTYKGSFVIPLTSFGEQRVTLVYEAGNNTIRVPFIELLILIDPSGFVYEGTVDNRLSGVKAVCEVLNNSGVWVRWEAERYGQVNPQLTDNNGKYGWDVPMGTYRVVFSKTGYQTLISQNVVVPPPKTDLNVGLISLARLVPPIVTGMSPSADASSIAVNSNVTAIFSKDMQAADLTSATFTLKRVTDAAGAPVNEADIVTNVTYNAAEKKVTLDPTADLQYGCGYQAKIAATVKDTDGNALGNDFIWEFTTAAQVTMATVELVKSFYGYGANVSISGQLLANGQPDTAAVAGDIAVKVTKPDGSVENLAANVVNGTFSAAYTVGNSGPQGRYTVTVTYGLPANDYNATFDVIDVPAPDASVPGGTYTTTQNVSLSSAAGGVIYYTTDGTVPGQDSNVYNGAIAVGTTTTIKAIAVVNGVSSSVATFTYTITSGGGVGGGGGGGGGVVQPQTTPTAESAKITEQLNSNAPSVIVSMAAGTKAIEIKGEDVNKVFQAGKPLQIQNAGREATLTVPAEAVALESGSKLVANVEKVSSTTAQQLTSSLASGSKLIGGIYELSIKRVTGTTTSDLTLKKPVKLALSYKDAAVTTAEEGNLGIFRYNDSIGKWELKGGNVNKTDKTVELELTGFSKYALMLKPAQAQEPQVKTFADITAHWAKKDIEFLATKGLVKGVSANSYQPDRQITRAEFATLLVNVLNISTASVSETKFSDVPAGAWYYKTVNAAFTAGLVKGVSATRFDPERNVTRQEMAAMVMNALSYKGKSIEVSQQDIEAKLAKFNDRGQVAVWAKNPVVVAMNYGIITGRSATALAPEANATRAESAVMIARLYTNIN